MNLTEFQQMFHKEIPQTELVLGILDSSFMLDVVNRLMFNYKVLMYQSLIQDLGGVSNLPDGKVRASSHRDLFTYYVQVGTHIFNLSIPRYSGGNEKLGLLTYMDGPLLASEMDAIELPSSAQSYKLLNDYGNSMQKLHGIVDKYEYLRLSVRTLDMILPPEQLNKLNPQWTHTPYWGSGTEASTLVLTELREGFNELISQAQADDAMAMVLY